MRGNEAEKHRHHRHPPWTEPADFACFVLPHRHEVAEFEARERRTTCGVITAVHIAIGRSARDTKSKRQCRKSWSLQKAQLLAHAAVDSPCGSTASFFAISAAELSAETLQVSFASIVPSLFQDSPMTIAVDTVGDR